ncbi:cytochrome P450 6B6-like [Galleria mellonella]|uniref:unspecific monooxygenase n=1 Tax=Galleria mellonella TaxID=7137 RepID=A0A6J1WPN0_GALME|nr:cytochrome P450 6B6-like [Galleria mellonella]
MIYIALVVVLLVALYLYNVRNFDYWEKRGVVYEKPIIFFGSVIRNYLLLESMTTTINKFYKKYPNEKLIGAFRSTTPILVLKDPAMVKQVIISDFVYFHERGIVPGKSLEPLFKNLFFGEGDLWRLLRQRLTPAFTSGKLRAMFPLIVERAENLRARALKAAVNGRTMDARDLMARYTTDFIGACGFGLDADSLNDEDAAFRQLGIKIFTFDFHDAIVVLLKDMFPIMARNLKIMGKVEKELILLVREILRKRNNKPSGRHDFIDLLLECQNQGTVVGQSIEKFNEDGSPKQARLEFDELIIAAQVFVFFAAGFETSSSATSFTLHQLAYHPEVQEKVHKEIDTVLAKYDNKLSYDAIKEMTYLEWTFKEAMRIFPSLGFLARTCRRKYTFPGTDLSIDEGVNIFIPIEAFHNDPQYWSKPQEFRPERFHPDEFNEIQRSIYLPFGDGPRNCIGGRLGLMQSLAGLAAILSQFRVEPAPETKRYPTVDPTSHVVQSISGGLPLLFNQRVGVRAC